MRATTIGLTTIASLALLGCPSGSDEGEDEVGDPTSATGASATGTDASESSDTSDTSDTSDSTDASDTTTGDGDACQDGSVPNLVFEEAFDQADYGWVHAERWRITSSTLVADPFFPDARSEQTGQQLEFFGLDPTPDPELFVLQYGPGWAESNNTPVLLVHGAADPPDRAWANPGVLGPYGCGDAVCPDTGLMQVLAAADIPVFAIVFPNTQGDNFNWVEQIHAAIEVIREQTCAAQVDVIGWSKGAFAARLYGSGLRMDGGTPLGDEVRKLILMGGPNLGFDYMFRYGSGNNTSVWPPGMSHGPTAHHIQVLGGVDIDRSEYAVYETASGYYFRGQAQMLSMWIDEYPLSAFANSGLGPYAVIDSLSTYWGEDMYAGFAAKGYGIEYAVGQGSIVADMVASEVPAEIQTYLLCGQVDAQADFMLGIPNEISGPSDGIVFVDSCAAPDGIANLGEAAVLQDINHLELGWSPESMAKIVGWLGEP